MNVTVGQEIRVTAPEGFVFGTVIAMLPEDVAVVRPKNPGWDFLVWTGLRLCFLPRPEFKHSHPYCRYSPEKHVCRDYRDVLKYGSEEEKNGLDLWENDHIPGKGQRHGGQS